MGPLSSGAVVTLRCPGDLERTGAVYWFVPGAVSIRERPAAVEDRAVPGHREGDLIEGSNKTCVATLVERHSRYVLLAKIDKKDSETVINVLIKRAITLPRELD